MNRFMRTFSSVSNSVIIVLVLFTCTGCGGPFFYRPSGFTVWQSYTGEPLQREELALLILDEDFVIDDLNDNERTVESEDTAWPGFPFINIATQRYAVVELKPGYHTLKARLHRYGVSSITHTAVYYAVWEGTPVTFRYNFYAGHIYQAYTEEFSRGSESRWRPIIEDVTDKPAGKKWLKEFKNCKYKRVPINRKPADCPFQTGSIY